MIYFSPGGGGHQGGCWTQVRRWGVNLCDIKESIVLVCLFGCLKAFWRTCFSAFLSFLSKFRMNHKKIICVFTWSDKSFDTQILSRVVTCGFMGCLLFGDSCTCWFTSIISITKLPFFIWDSPFLNRLDQGPILGADWFPWRQTQTQHFFHFFPGFASLVIVYYRPYWTRNKFFFVGVSSKSKFFKRLEHPVLLLDIPIGGIAISKRKGWSAGRLKTSKRGASTEVQQHLYITDLVGSCDAKRNRQSFVCSSLLLY